LKGGTPLSLSNPRGYEDKSLVIARVSKLARWRAPYAVGGEVSTAALFLPSMSKANDPKPVDAFENWDAVDIPKVLLLGGAGRSKSSSALASTFVSTVFGLLMKDCWLRGEEVGGPPKVCCPSGETGGVRSGLFEIGEGGTKGNDSRMESALVDVAESMEDPDSLRLWFKPSASARAWAWAKALCCCCSKVPISPVDGVISLAIVFLLGERRVFALWGELNPKLTRVALSIPITVPAWVSILEGRVLLSPRCHGRREPSSPPNSDWVEALDCLMGEVRPKAVVVGEADEATVVCVDTCLSLKGLSPPWPSSLPAISLGPKEVEASGDLTEGLDITVDGLKASPLMTSALTTPRTCLTAPLLGVIIIGASLRKSLE
jgi:hypothetical protein